MLTSTLNNLPKPIILGVINVTPDSFSDGGDIMSVDECIQKIREFLEVGATCVDIGAESTRPGATPLPLEDEWSRLKPFLNRIESEDLISKISVDTQKPEVMIRATEMGCGTINCVGNLPSVEVLSELIRMNPDLNFIAMHMHGAPRSMQANPLPAKSILMRIEAFFESAHEDLVASGFLEKHLWMDPGIGFGKTDGANARILMALPKWSKTYQIACGVSRKSLLGRLTGIETPKDRDPVSKIAEIGCLLAGAKMIRTHDVHGLSQGLSNLSEVFS